MSGVMLKTAIYGLLRVTFDLLHAQLWWWGVVALALGLATALFGVVFAAVQSDMKRLLAYSSIENIGIIVAGIGLAILFKAYGKTLLAAITLTAVLYHCAQPRVLQEPAVPRHRLGAARDEGAEPRQARRPHPPDAVGGVARARRHAGRRRHSAAQRLRLGMAAAAGLPVHAEPAAVVRQHAGAAGRGRARAVRGAGGLRDGQVLRRRLPRPAARAEPRLREGRRPVRARRARLARGGLRPARRPSGQRDRAHRPGQRRC